MKCKKIKKLINESLERQLSSQEKQRLESHLAKCEDCRLFSEELRQLVEVASSLEEPEPSPRVWEKIKASLQEETARLGEATKTPEISPWAFIFRPLAVRYALSGLLVVVFLGLSFFLWRQTHQPTEGLGRPGQKYALAKLAEARHHYQKAIEALTEALASQEESLDPEILAELRESLAVIEATINSYELAVRQNPRDIETQSELLMAYQRKVDLLEASISRETPFWE
ncbi:anti-sigma factor [Candidatus Aminicenantes bacterium AC-334-K16]|jgi:tetratricopeptide (TPR) repeat protein|nr:anti-sigma factor [Candidatus Aminicenantes bacterium AC-334-K16]